MLRTVGVLTIRRFLRLPDERSAMKVDPATLLLHHERVQEHSPGGLVRDLLHHPVKVRWFPRGETSACFGDPSARGSPGRHLSADRSAKREEIVTGIEKQEHSREHRTRTIPQRLARSSARARLRYTIESTHGESCRSVDARLSGRDFEVPR